MVWRVWRGSGNDDAHQGVDRVGSTAKDSFDAGFVEDVKAAVAVFTVFLYASGLAGVSLSLSLSLSLLLAQHSSLIDSTLRRPLPIFWSLFDQHSSRWVFQAKSMNRDLYFYHPDPDQIPTLNPALMLLFLPIFSYGIYPMLRKLGVRCGSMDEEILSTRRVIANLHDNRSQLDFSPIRRMVVGMFFTALAFVASGVVQLFIDDSATPIHITWQLPQYILLAWGEIMVSVTGLEFAYSQAPTSMKSLIMVRFSYR